MFHETKKYAQDLSVKVTYVCFVPGVFDMPLIVKAMLKKKSIDAVITLGAVIKGETGHDKVIAHNTAKTLRRSFFKIRQTNSTRDNRA